MASENGSGISLRKEYRTRPLSGRKNHLGAVGAVDSERNQYLAWRGRILGIVFSSGIVAGLSEPSG